MTVIETNLSPETSVASTDIDEQDVALQQVVVENGLSYARGLMTITKITDHPGDGLVITWSQPGVERTPVSAIGEEKPLYDFLKLNFPDFAKVAGAHIYIDTNEDGLPKEFGINGTDRRCSI